MIGLVIGLLLIAGAIGLVSRGQLAKLLLEGQIRSTREAWTAIDTIGDYEVGRGVAFSQLGQLEGMHYLAPASADALLMLTRAWASATYAFIEDDMEEAEDEGGQLSEPYRYHRARAVSGYDRAVRYGVALLERRRAGFTGAARNDETMRAWLAAFDDPKRDAEALFWTGYAWMARVNVSSEDPAVVGDLFIGVAMMERAVELDSGIYHGSAHGVLGAYHARSAMAELDEAKSQFDTAVQMSQGRLLLPRFQLAALYHCVKGDRESYVETLTAVVEAGDVFPEQRLTNVVAQRRARRYLGEGRMKACGF